MSLPQLPWRPSGTNHSSKILNHLLDPIASQVLPPYGQEATLLMQQVDNVLQADFDLSGLSEKGYILENEFPVKILP